LNIQHSTFNILLLLLLALPAAASDLQVDKRTLSIDDTLTITITLTDSFAAVDDLRLPLQNLAVEGSPSVSSEFSWSNGQSSRRKVFRYVAHPRGPGAALVGPLTLRGSEGQVETLAPVSIEVLPDAAAGSNDPLTIFHEMQVTNRDPIFVVAEANKSSVFAGEEVVVTWTIYNGANVQEHAIADVPKLADFWVEELDTRGESPRQVVLGGLVIQKLVIRRVALFPLRSGTLTIEPLAVDAQIMKRTDLGNPFGLFEGTVVDVHRHSAPLTIEARPIPPGPPVAAIGDVSLQCQMPLQKNGGPVSIDVVMSGAANLRAATPPAFARPLEGNLQITEAGVTVQRRDEAVMTRRWRLLIFPAASGMFVVPPLVTDILTSAGVRRELRCEERALMVESAQVPALDRRPQSSPAAGIDAARRSLPLIAIVAVILLGIALSTPRLARWARIRRETRLLIGSTAAETRTAVDEWLVAHNVEPASMIRETSDRGDAYRTLRSLLDAAERDRLVADAADLRGRVRDVIASM
jgi:hypothetical protein